jgi:hypothetical protein
VRVPGFHLSGQGSGLVQSGLLLASLEAVAQELHLETHEKKQHDVSETEGEQIDDKKA